MMYVTLRGFNPQHRNIMSINNRNRNWTTNLPLSARLRRNRAVNTPLIPKSKPCVGGWRHQVEPWLPSPRGPFHPRNPTTTMAKSLSVLQNWWQRQWTAVNVFSGCPSSLQTWRRLELSAEAPSGMDYSSVAPGSAANCVGWRIDFCVYCAGATSSINVSHLHIISFQPPAMPSSLLTFIVEVTVRCWRTFKPPNLMSHSAMRMMVRWLLGPCFLCPAPFISF